MPKFSIIIPVYQVEKYVRQCIESVINQTFTDFEALVVDDCGEDKSIEIVKEYAKQDKRIKILHHKHNRGLAAARNTALSSAKGDYIVCLDSDDWMIDNCLATLYAIFNKYDTQSVWFNSRNYYENEHKLDKNPMYTQEEGWRILEPENIASFTDFTWIKAYTRESIQKHNLGWPEGLTFEDGEFYFKYYTYNPKTYVLSDPLINYRRRDGSIVRNADKGDVHMEDLYDVIRHLRDFWIQEGVYEKYKIAILKLIQNRIRMAKKLTWNKHNLELAYKFLKDMKFPDDFSNYTNF